jgi:hypothetical protein
MAIRTLILERPDEIERLVHENPDALSTTNNRPWARLLVHASGRASGRVIETLLRTVMRHRSGLSIVNRESSVQRLTPEPPLMRSRRAPESVCDNWGKR